MPGSLEELKVKEIKNGEACWERWACWACCAVPRGIVPRQSRLWRGENWRTGVSMTQRDSCAQRDSYVPCPPAETTLSHPPLPRRAGRLAMLAFIGFTMAAQVTGKNPLAALREHLDNPLGELADRMQSACLVSVQLCGDVATS